MNYKNDFKMINNKNKYEKNINEIAIQYKNKKNSKKIKIFGKEFVEKNKNIFKIIYKKK